MAVRLSKALRANLAHNSKCQEDIMPKQVATWLIKEEFE